MNPLVSADLHLKFCQLVSFKSLLVREIFICFLPWTGHFLGSESINTLLLAASALGRDPQLFEGRKVFALS